MAKIALILTGGAIGSLAGYLIAGMTQKYFGGQFPVGTLTVNLTGALLIGLIWGIFEVIDIAPNTRTFVVIGVLGGFTTFSTYTAETLNLFRIGHAKLALMNILASNVLGIILVFGGFLLGRELSNLFK